MKLNFPDEKKRKKRDERSIDQLSPIPYNTLDEIIKRRKVLLRWVVGDAAEKTCGGEAAPIRETVTTIVNNDVGQSLDMMSENRRQLLEVLPDAFTITGGWYGRPGGGMADAEDLKSLTASKAALVCGCKQ